VKGGPDDKKSGWAEVRMVCKYRGDKITLCGTKRMLNIRLSKSTGGFRCLGSGLVGSQKTMGNTQKLRTEMGFKKWSKSESREGPNSVCSQGRRGIR